MADWGVENRPGLLSQGVSHARLATHIRKRAVCTVANQSADQDEFIELMLMLGLFGCDDDGNLEFIEENVLPQLAPRTSPPESYRRR